MTKLLKNVASVTTVAGAVIASTLIAANVGLEVVGYSLFLAASVAAVYLLVTTPAAPRALIYQNVFFILVNIFGLVRHGFG